MTEIKTFSTDAMAALRRDHEALRYEVRQLRTTLRSFSCELEGSGLKPICRFTLDAALATSDASKAATITGQYCRGKSHVTTAITVYNFLTKTAGVYEYHGASGAAGKAFYDPKEKKWHIFDMECPTS